MIVKTLSQNTLAIPSKEITIQLYLIDYNDNRVINKFIKNIESYPGVNHQKFNNFIDILLTITATIPTIKDFILKD
jgi:hypothetical protein